MINNNINSIYELLMIELSSIEVISIWADIVIGYNNDIRTYTYYK